MKHKIISSILILTLSLIMLKVILPNTAISSPKVVEAEKVATTTEEGTKQEEPAGEGEADPDRAVEEPPY